MTMKRWVLLVVPVLGLAAPPVRAADDPAVQIQVKGDQIDFLIGKELVGSYQKGPKVAKPYMWPLLGPGGVQMTPHQKSLWFCHGDVIPEGIVVKEKIRGIEGVDFWSEAKGHGKMICTRVEEPKVSGSHGQVTTYNEWQTGSGDKLLDEKRTLHLHRLGDGRLFVWDIDLTAAVPVTFGDTKEGSFGIRINDEIREVIEGRNPATGKAERKKGPGQLENAEGKVGRKADPEPGIWGYRSAWCDYSGPIQGKVAGLAIFDDAANPYPAYWHSRAYGLMAANPFGRARSDFPEARGKTDLVKLAKGEHLKLRYGIFLHSGDAKEGKVAENYQQFLKLR
jgi:hypothetical protein